MPLSVQYVSSSFQFIVLQFIPIFWKVVRVDNDDDCPNVTDHEIMENLSSHGVELVKLDPILSNPDVNSGSTARAQRKHVNKIKKAKQKAAAESMKQRKRILGQPGGLAKQFYEPDRTYTFDYYDS